MKTQKPYLTQYCNLNFEWHCRGLNIDDVSEEEAIFSQELRKKTLEQSGLTENELLLISTCRNHNILKKVCSYARKAKSEQ
ncbi:MAG: hypothetical protein FWE22_07525 [Firmicutes bacterium]|nr:hypothetical protein [Bacillota bacterium]